jgi:DNA-binding beta-propeller fold protein YncE
MLNAASGHQMRTLRFPVGSHADQVVVDERRGRAYVLLAPSTGRTLTVLVLDAASGRIVRTLTLLTAGPTASLSAPLGRYALDVDPRSGELYVTEGTAGIVHGLDGGSGRLLWSVSLHPLAGIPDYSPTIRPPLEDAQTEHLFVFDYRTGLVSVLDARTGHRVRTVPMPPGGIDLVACRRTQRVFVFHGGNVSVLDAASGRLLRTVAIGPPRGLGPAVVDEHDGRLFLVNWLRGAILVLNAYTGRVVRTIVVGGVPTNLVISQRLGRVFVSTMGLSGLHVTTGREGNGSVHVLDGRSGIIVRTWPVGLLPGAMAVDERHRYLVVLNLNGSDLGPGPWAWIPAWLRRWLPFLPRVPVPQTVASSVTVIDLSHV